MLCRARFGRDRAQRLWRLCLGASLLLHAALLWLPAGAPSAPSASRALRPALTLTLKSPSPAATVSLAPSSPALAAVRGESRSAARRPRAVLAAPSVAPPARASLPAPSSSSASASAPVDLAPHQLDVDGMRAQARDLAHGDRPRSPVAASAALDDVRLAALARRVGQPLAAASERRLADGSRMIRFAGNVCLHLPRDLPMGFENSFGPTVLVPTNCRD